MARISYQPNDYATFNWRMGNGAVLPEDLRGLEAAIYDESVRTIGEQSKLLDSLRTRAGTLLAAANIATAFLGGLALTRTPAGHVAGDTHLHGLAWVAVALFCVAFGLSLIVLTPSRNWVFWHHPHDLLGVYVDPGPPTTLSEFRRTIAYYNGTHYNRNGKRLTWLFGAFSGATLALGAEVVIWLVVLAR
ncbi:MAG: hypothetical protein WAQ33_14960 [Gaiellaceae bacterium]